MSVVIALSLVFGGITDTIPYISQFGQITVEATTANQMKIVAESQLGNKGTKYKNFGGVDGHWCAMFVSWCAREAGISKDAIPTTALVQTYLDFAKNTGRFVDKTQKPQVGDIAIMKNNGGSHVNIVVDVNVNDDKVTTVGGNEGGSGSGTAFHNSSSVKESTWSWNSDDGNFYKTLTGWFRPAYSGTPPPPPIDDSVRRFPTSSAWIPNGIYLIQHIRTGRGIEIDNGNMTAGRQAQLWDMHGGNHQKFKLTRNDDGSYTIVPLHNTGMALDVWQASTNSGVAIAQSAVNGNNNQRWYIVEHSPGSFEIVSKHSGLAWDISGGGTAANGAKLQQYSCNDSDAQRFKLTGIGDVMFSRKISEKGQGLSFQNSPDVASADSLQTNKDYYMWYRMFDSIAPDQNLNSRYKLNYKVELQLLDSSGKSLGSAAFANDDSNWAKINFGSPGKYTCRWKLTGDLQGIWDTAVTVSAPVTTYTISYNANNGSGAPSSQTKTHGANLTLSSTKPTRTGYTFAGWATTATGAVAYQPGGTYTGNANQTLFAVWTANTYTITYDANGGTGTPSSQTKTHNISINLSSTRPTRAGYTFKGWATSASATTATHQSGTAYTANSGITLYAVWEMEIQVINYAEIRYNANGGSGVPDSQVTIRGVSITLSNMRPTRADYTFRGWATSASATAATHQPGEAYVANSAVTFYAVWTKNTPATTQPPATTTQPPATTTQPPATTTQPPATTTQPPVENHAKYEVDSVEASFGETVEISIRLTNNTGIISLRNTISYDEDALELVSVKDSGLLKGYTSPLSSSISPYTIRWADSLALFDNKANGNIVTLTFKIKDNTVPADYAITVTTVEARNYQGDRVEITEGKGIITVVDNSYIKGDVSGDGEVDDWDAILLGRYLANWDVEIDLRAADIDGDGEITDWDYVLLSRYLAGWSDVL